MTGVLTIIFFNTQRGKSENNYQCLRKLKYKRRTKSNFGEKIVDDNILLRHLDFYGTVDYPFTLLKLYLHNQKQPDSLGKTSGWIYLSDVAEPRESILDH